MRTMIRLPKSQRGAAAIEMAFVFTLFFAVFYAIVSYAVPMMMVQAFNHAAASAARAAVAVDTVQPDQAAYHTVITNHARHTAGQSLDWLPLTAKTAVLGEGQSNENIRVEIDGDNILTVTVEYTDYMAAPLIPTLKLPGIGDVPRLPQHLRGQASVRL